MVRTVKMLYFDDAECRVEDSERCLDDVNIYGVSTAKEASTAVNPRAVLFF